MDEKMQQVETTLGQTARKCNSAAVNSLFTNFASFDDEFQLRQSNPLYTFYHLILADALVGKDRAVAAQLAILKSCHAAMSTLLQRGGSPYISAKVVVLARLLHNTLSEQPNASPLVDSLRDRLASSRRRLLKQIDRNFSVPKTDTTKLVENLCARSLATSSGPTDVLRHFLHIRLESMRNSPAIADSSRLSMTRAIRLFKGTLSDAQTIFPRRLSDALSKLKNQPLLQDKDIQSLRELNLDVHGRWIADEVRNFTPWPRHDELQRAEAEKIVKAWSPMALKTLKSVIEAILSNEDDLATTTKLREEIIEIHLSSTSRIQGVDSSEILDVLRHSFNDRLCSIITLRAEALKHFSESVFSMVQVANTLSTDEGISIWQIANAPPSLDRGAAKFKEAVSDGYHGYSNEVKHCLSKSEQWKEGIKEAQSLIKDMKERRWEDDLLDVASDTDDDVDLDSKQALLSEDDPRRLSEILATALDAALAQFADDFQENAASVSDEDVSKAIFLLRILRNFTQSVTGLPVVADSSSSKGMARIISQDSSLTRPIMTKISSSVAEKAIGSFQDALSKFVNKRSSKFEILWEGQPPMPVQPSPSAFSLPVALEKVMATVGQDLWAPVLVRVLKQQLEEALHNVFETAIKDLKLQAEDGEQNGTAHTLNGVSEKSSEVEGKDGMEEENEETGQSKMNGEAEDSSSSVVESNAAEDTNSTNSALNKGAVIKGKLTQLLFDMLYLNRVLQIPRGIAQENSHPRDSLISLLVKELELATGQVEKMEKSASEHWRRTYLLVGLLT